MTSGLLDNTVVRLPCSYRRSLSLVKPCIKSTISLVLTLDDPIWDSLDVAFAFSALACSADFETHCCQTLSNCSFPSVSLEPIRVRQPLALSPPVAFPSWSLGTVA